MTPAEPEATPCKSVQELLERYGVLAYDKQNDLFEVIGENSWSFDMAAGAISFGPALVFPVQILGTFSHASQSWLWAWANTQSGIPERLLAQARQLKTYGEQQEIDLLKHDAVDAEEDDLHLIGSIAAGMFDASGYYLADYGQGVMLVTVQSEQIDRLRTNDLPRLLHAFPQAISLYELRHRPAFISYATLKGYTVTEAADSVTASSAAGTLTATFDDLGRLSNLTGSSS
ncbi:DUF6882 domain-containing protein [Hymenobacter jeollabukensis]|uniref:Uncharacterized protein n=1 Tax=Hymenobacter jeollabukensis TaxID=2025313 RepID=A0A5R8WHP7_9BACT|nr:DUF6882 domain-containing protein [Hymenobacter jeollabukensis]TLM87880.1 hypothetical protein FDY95_24880 [Hymenobacter jeollabukensis]